MMRQRIEPGPGQESVWDYPRPPRLEPSSEHIQVVFNGVTIADTHKSMRMLETSHPPVYYIPPDDVLMQHFTPTSHRSFCEFKGRASYFTIQVGERRAENAAWCYAGPVQMYLPMKDYLAFYPARMDACYVDGEAIQAQEGDFYGGWITSKIVGPFKGASGTWGW
jgi:uncharacterized protein (DUF427 family)